MPVACKDELMASFARELQFWTASLNNPPSDTVGRSNDGNSSFWLNNDELDDPDFIPIDEEPLPFDQ